MNTSIYFMHVAKAAGSTVNEVIARQFPADSVVLHFESSPKTDDHLLRTKRFISGHPFYYVARKRLPFIESFFKVTVFREPVKQLMSHIAWVRKLAEPENLPEFYKHAGHFQEMAIRLKNTDLSSSRELTLFANNLNRFERTTFSNFQTRYLIPLPSDDMSLVDFEEVKCLLGEFDIVGTTESLDSFFRTLFKAMRWTCPDDIASQNIAGNYFGLDPSDPAQKRALSPLLKHDQRLYEMVCQQGR
jgi:hypothetical protein